MGGEGRVSGGGALLEPGLSRASKLVGSWPWVGRVSGAGPGRGLVGEGWHLRCWGQVPRMGRLLGSREEERWDGR